MIVEKVETAGLVGKYPLVLGLLAGPNGCEFRKRWEEYFESNGSEFARELTLMEVGELYEIMDEKAREGSALSREFMEVAATHPKADVSHALGRAFLLPEDILMTVWLRSGLTAGDKEALLIRQMELGLPEERVAALVRESSDLTWVLAVNSLETF